MGQAVFNSPESLFKGIKADFYGKFGQAQDTNYTPIIYKATSTQTLEQYIINDTFPAIREWTDDGIQDTLTAYSVNVQNRDWTLRVKELRNTLEDGKASLGMAIENTISDSVNKFKMMPDKLIQELLAANPTAFDGTAFFSDTRPNLSGSGVIDNIHTGTGTTLAQMTADFASAESLLLGFKDRNNEPLNNQQDYYVLVPSQLYSNAYKLMTSDSLANPYDNIYKNRFKIIVNYYQATTDNDWYLVNAAQAFKPFIYQVRKEPDWTMKDDPEDKWVKYIANARMAAAVGNPTAIVKINN